jgi:hypothetical protein
VREIDEVQDAVHHRVAEGDQRVHAAEHQAVDGLLDEGVHETSWRLDRAGAS